MVRSKEKERRKFKRFDAYMSVKFLTEEGKKCEGVSLSKDISREGLKIATTEQLKEGSNIQMQIDIPDDPRPIRTAGQVVWTKKVEGENGFEHGVRFLMMDPVDRFRALDYAYNHWLEMKVNDLSDPEKIPEIEA